jgi:hypothetical protein
VTCQIERVAQRLRGVGTLADGREVEHGERDHAALALLDMSRFVPVIRRTHRCYASAHTA